ncbi:flavodoxin family protein [Clostridium sp. MCC353]|nr:flavodoxin family protein [Clostridium sp. MCC353]
MENKKMLALLGSPRVHGNIASMLSCAVTEAERLGYQVNVVNLYEKKIGYCRGCMGCKQSGICVIDDDLGEIRTMLKECDAVVLAAPVYFANVPGIVKNMFDRLVGAVMDDNDSPVPKPRLSKNQTYYLLTACNTPFPFSVLGGQSTGAVRAMKEFFHISGMRYGGAAVFAGTRKKNGISKKMERKIAGMIKRGS